MKLSKYGMYAALVSSVAISTVAQATLLIDDFSAPGTGSQEVEDLLADSNGVGNTFDDASILGGERDLFVSLLTQAGSSSSGVFMGVENGGLVYETGSGDVGTATIQYDGDDNDAENVDVDGLGAVDLTSQGNAFLLDVIESDIGFSFAINVWSDLGMNFATQSYTAQGTNNPVVRSFKFSDFTGINFAAISAIEFVINTDGTDGLTSIDFRVGALSVPEPASMFLFGAGLLGFAGMKRRKQ